MASKLTPTGNQWQDNALELDDSANFLDRRERSRGGMHPPLVFAQALEQFRRWARSVGNRH
jgi:hypothetical protein